MTKDMMFTPIPVDKELYNDAVYNSGFKLVLFTSLHGHKHIIYTLLFQNHVFFCLRNRKMLP